VVAEFISKVKKPNDDQSEGNSGFRSSIAHFFSEKVPSNFTITGLFFTEQAVNSKKKKITK
jgi:hypothetical protein